LTSALTSTFTTTFSWAGGRSISGLVENGDLGLGEPMVIVEAKGREGKKAGRKEKRTGS